MLPSATFERAATDTAIATAGATVSTCLTSTGIDRSTCLPEHPFGLFNQRKVVAESGVSRATVAEALPG